MTKEQALEKMKKWIEHDDTEEAHKGADTVLCEFLKALGHSDLVELYDKIEMWYA